MSFHDSARVLYKILTEHPEIDMVQLQINYVDWDDLKIQSRRCYEVCKKHGKPVFVMEPVKGGTLVNLPQEALKEMKGVSPASYAIRFAAGLPEVAMVLSGMSSLEQMQDNLSFMTEAGGGASHGHLPGRKPDPLYRLPLLCGALLWADRHSCGVCPDERCAGGQARSRGCLSCPGSGG